MLLNLYALEKSSVNGPGERVVIWVQGCKRNCPGCFNQSARAFIERELVSLSEIKKRIRQCKISGLTFSGGEPFEQAKFLARLAKWAHTKNLSVVCYSGYTLQELQNGNNNEWTNLLNQIDLLIDGPFMKDLVCHDPYRGSSNQCLHFLSGRIKPEEMQVVQEYECILKSDGTVVSTGFPDEGE